MAESIRTSSFRIQKTGRSGRGVYFWKKSYFGFELAKGWYRQAKDERRYESQANKGGAVINCRVDVDETEFLNLDEERQKDRLTKFCSERNSPGFWDERRISELHDLFIGIAEGILKVKFKVIQKSLPPPKDDCCNYPRRALGYPTCYIARDTSTITIESVNPV